MKIAIIGVGIAGATLAKILSGKSDVTVFEKARGMGGRMSTRYADSYQFDHGAQYFTAKTPLFRGFLQPFIDQGVVEPWQARFVEIEEGDISKSEDWNEAVPHYVAVPKMNQLVKHIATDIDVRVKSRIARIERKHNKWCLYGEDGGTRGEFDWVISSAPALQTAMLFPLEFKYHDCVEKVKMLGCYSLMVGLGESLSLSWDAAMIQDSDIQWVAVNSTKPGRPKGYSLIAHARNDWAEEHIEDDQEVVKAHLLDVLSDIVGAPLVNPEYLALHRWRYANVSLQHGEKALVDHELQLAACGDWCIEGGVEESFTSAMAVADEILTS